ncbi:hypothetical protein EDB86DRAFT_2829052 [Lactarius hatsudake]|nr:hypothetical protein EDB86DRAFT_2829052 [Lactarius hatsudake]
MSGVPDLPSPVPLQHKHWLMGYLTVTRPMSACSSTTPATAKPFHNSQRHLKALIFIAFDTEILTVASHASRLTLPYAFFSCFLAACAWVSHAPHATLLCLAAAQALQPRLFLPPAIPHVTAQRKHIIQWPAWICWSVWNNMGVRLEGQLVITKFAGALDAEGAKAEGGPLHLVLWTRPPLGFALYHDLFPSGSHWGLELARVSSDHCHPDNPSFVVDLA